MSSPESYVTTQDIPFSNVNAWTMLSNVSKEMDIPKSEEELRNLCDEIIQSYIDSREQPLTEYQLRNVENTIEYLIDSSVLESTEYDEQARKMDGIIQVVKLGSKALIVNTLADDAEVPLDYEKLEEQTLNKLEDTILTLFENGVIDSRAAQALILIFKLRNSESMYSVEAERIAAQSIQSVFERLKVEFADQQTVKEKGSSLLKYQNPRIENGMTSIGSIRHFMKVPKSRANVMIHPLDVYYETRIGKYHMNISMAASRAEILADIEYTLREGLLA